MTIKSAANKSLTILVAVLALYICGSVYAEGPKANANNAKAKPAVKLPDFKNAKDITFDEDDQKFFVWLNEYFPDKAAGLKDFEKNPKEYQVKFDVIKDSDQRLWKGYKVNKKLGKALVVEVKLRRRRNEVLDNLKATTDKKAKDKLRVELTKVVSNEFDSAVEIKRIRYQHFSARINRMKKGLTNRQEEVKQLVEHKDAEIKKRVDELKKGTEKTPWTYPKNKGVSPVHNTELRLKESKDVKFTEDDHKFFIWLYEFFPDYAKDIRDLEKSPNEYNKKFREYRHIFRRLWRVYKLNKEYGKRLVEEVKLKAQRLDILKKLETTKDQKQKAKLQNNLTMIVTKEFDIAVKVKKHRYQGLKRKINRKEKELPSREDEVKKLVANKDQEVKKRVDDLIKGEEKINWK
jgi:hypothetical protein